MDYLRISIEEANRRNITQISTLSFLFPVYVFRSLPHPLLTFAGAFNQPVRDLLVENSAGLDLRMGPDEKVDVVGLREVSVQSMREVTEVMELGWRNRATSSTHMNDRSSRSHAVLRITTRGKNLFTDTSTSAVLSLIDLAGSERVSE